jgi:hypothetical protein
LKVEYLEDYTHEDIYNICKYAKMFKIEELKERKLNFEKTVADFNRKRIFYKNWFGKNKIKNK